MSSSTLIFSGGLCAVLAYAAGMIEAGELSTGDLVAFMAYTILLGHSFSAATDSWARWQQLLGAGPM